MTTFNIFLVSFLYFLPLSLPLSSLLFLLNYHLSSSPVLLITLLTCTPITFPSQFHVTTPTSGYLCPSLPLPPSPGPPSHLDGFFILMSCHFRFSPVTPRIPVLISEPGDLFLVPLLFLSFYSPLFVPSSFHFYFIFHSFHLYLPPSFLPSSSYSSSPLFFPSSSSLTSFLYLPSFPPSFLPLPLVLRPPLLSYLFLCISSSSLLFPAFLLYLLSCLSISSSSYLPFSPFSFLSYSSSLPSSFYFPPLFLSFSFPSITSVYSLLSFIPSLSVSSLIPFLILPSLLSLILYPSHEYVKKINKKKVLKRKNAD